MLATFLNSPLKRRFMTAILLLAASVIGALGLLFYLLAAGTLSLAAFAWGALACLVGGTAAAFWLIRRVVDRFSRALRAVTASLQGGERRAIRAGSTTRRSCCSRAPSTPCERTCARDDLARLTRPPYLEHGRSAADHERREQGRARERRRRRAVQARRNGADRQERR
jgi:hypothetical protein